MVGTAECGSSSASGRLRSEVSNPDISYGRAAGARGSDVSGRSARRRRPAPPFSLIPDLRSAWNIVGSAARPNGSVVFDTWHFFRGDPDFRLLSSLPGGAIAAVQVSDAPAKPGGALATETFNRLLPGDGELDLVAVLWVLDGLDALRWVGAEVLSPATAAMTARHAAIEATSRVRELVARARGGGGGTPAM